MARIYMGMAEGQREMVVADSQSDAVEQFKAMSKNTALAGRKVLNKWDNEVYEIIHEVWGKYVIKNIKCGTRTKVEKHEVILINNM